MDIATSTRIAIALAIDLAIAIVITVVIAVIAILAGMRPELGAQLRTNRQLLARTRARMDGCAHHTGL